MLTLRESMPPIYTCCAGAMPSRSVGMLRLHTCCGVELGTSYPDYFWPSS